MERNNAEDTSKLIRYQKMWQSLRSNSLPEKYLPRWNQIYEGINLYPEYNGSVKRIYR